MRGRAPHVVTMLMANRLRAGTARASRAGRLLGSLCAGLALGSCGAGIPDGPFARATQIGGLDEVIGGEKAIARPGDFILENDHYRVAILGGRHSMGPGLYGGSLVDADLRVRDPRYDGGRGRDQWNELFPTFNMNVPLADASPTVTVVDDGADGSAAVVRVQGKGEPFLTLLWALWGLVQMPEMWFSHEYVAEPGVPWLTLRSTVLFSEPDVGAEPPVGAPMVYPSGGIDVVGVGVERGLIAGDFFLSGGSVDVFAPGIGFDEDGAVFRANEAGLNIFSQPLEFPFVAGVSDGVSYGIVPKEGSAYVPLFTASQTAVVSAVVDGNGTADRFGADEAFTFERYFLIGHGDVGSIVDQYVEVRGIPYGEVRGRVVEQGSGLALSGADVFVFEPGAAYPFSQWRTDVRRDDGLQDGSFEGRLPVGEWEVLVHQQGRPDAARVPISVTEGGEVALRLESPRPGVVTFTIRDETGAPIPAKLTLFRADPNQPTNRLPELGDPFHGGDPEWVVFADTGSGELALPPGKYEAVASRGVEYEIDWSGVFEVGADRAGHLDLQVFRSVDTSGWVSADLHVHSAPSHDSGVTLPDRVRTMACEGVEFFASTDHDYITDFAPVVEEMGLEAWVQTTPGIETTTIEQGHFLAFPLSRDFRGDNGGALDWQGLPPQSIIDGLRAKGDEAGTEPLIFVAHPRDGILGYLDQYGFDPFEGEVGEPSFSTPLFYVLAANATDTVNDAELVSLDFDAFELFTGKRQDINRTPTAPELDAYIAEDASPAGPDDDATNRAWFERTMAEQDALSSDVFRLTSDIQGNVDDWFALLNLGYRQTAIGNSDTHGMTSTEAGCPRNWVISDTDSPAFIDDQAVADAVREHRVVASYGPFLQMWVEDAVIGSDVAAEGTVDVRIEVQAPSWIDVDRVELYENGTLIAEWDVPPGAAAPRFAEAISLQPTQDAWYVAIAMGEESLAPVFTPVEIPYIPLDEAVTGALGGLTVFQTPALAGLLTPIPFPKKYAVLPYALTNPIWVDVDGGGFTPPGRAAWAKPAP